jgi:alkylhydroperoxidase family enzyme
MAEFEPALKKRLEDLWGEPVNLYRALGNHPRLAAAWTEFANSIRHDSRTPRTLREIMILRTAQIARSEYEWAQHLKMARKAGVREAQIAALADWRSSKEFDAAERAALALTEGVMAGRVDDAVHAEARKRFPEPGDYVELCLTAAFYAMVSRMLDAMGVELDPDVREHAPRLA